ncbi:MAG TPA: alpha amylase family protein, partial [Capsulimonadaceae bacterium]|nr:alpha amylase family protein [Capsulimonadaceae bacterium]
VYVGSWYGQYDLLGSNWAGDDLQAPFDFLTASYQKTGYAGLLDWLTTGCYYNVATISEGNDNGDPGASVEAAGQLSNRIVDDHAWVYAGLYMATIGNDPAALARCLQAAAASTQGIMVFDLSQINQYNFWPVFAQAFAQPAQPPQSVPGLLDQVRRQHDQDKKSGIQPPPISVYGGVENTGL